LAGWDQLENFFSLFLTEKGLLLRNFFRQKFTFSFFFAKSRFRKFEFIAKNYIHWIHWPVV